MNIVDEPVDRPVDMDCQYLSEDLQFEPVQNQNLAMSNLNNGQVQGSTNTA